MVTPEDPLPDFLARADAEAVRTFAAACVERASGVFFWVASREGDRQADADTYLAALDALWEPQPPTPQAAEEQRQRVSEFPELGDDYEPPGEAAYAFDAVSALTYAYSYLATGDTEWITYEATCLVNSAYYLDEAVGGEAHVTAERAAQRQDIADLSGPGRQQPSAVLRDRARAAARDKAAALQVAEG
ncbi:MAG: hypothetical protein QOF98_2128 [Streptomyces sp.]|nr:hypothetical protein [Streptomyces sp.]